MAVPLGKCEKIGMVNWDERIMEIPIPIHQHFILGLFFFLLLAHKDGEHRIVYE